ncbi:unnamed protein product [Larinioides sclopetarius]|uniref:SHSP domain-containing protein n=1 Tax=Larinioides sclopetarius TaxID=280406 RepID=A0AAV2BJX2_9ARAC
MVLLDDDLLPAVLRRGLRLRPRTRANIDSSGASEVQNEADKFKVTLNVSHFKPDEISVKTVNNTVVIHGKHEEKTDEHGFVSREFTRRYMLPEGAEPEKVESKLAPEGVLTIEVPKKVVEPVKSYERVVPIDVVKPAIEGEPEGK